MARLVWCQPDTVEGYFNLLEEDIMIYLGMPGCRYLSELPREPWVGGRFAYQIPLLLGFKSHD